MMATKWNVFLAVCVALGLLFGATSTVFAQTATPPVSVDEQTGGQPDGNGIFVRLAEALGMNVTDLKAALQGGKTVAQLAQEKGINLSTLITDITKINSERLTKAVADGKMTQAEADQRLNTIKTDLNEWFTTGKVPAELKLARNIRQDEQIVADALGMSMVDFRSALKSGKTISQLAQENGVSLDALLNELSAKRSANLQKAVSDGKMTQAQADQLLNNFKQGLQTWFDTGKPPASFKLTEKVKEQGQILTESLGMSTDDLKSALKSGKTVAQLAQEKGISLDSIVTDLAADRAEKLQKAVEAGKMTQDQANQALEKMKENIRNRLENKLPRPAATPTSNATGSGL